MLAQDNQHILEAFKDGNVQGIAEPGVTPQHIKTWISHVFLFPKNVYKIYQHENEGFNKDYRDLHTPESREWFYGEDFFWNHYFAPNVYEELLGIKADGDKVTIVARDDNPDDLVIKMRRIDASHNLTQRLPVGDLTQGDMHTVGYEMTRLIAEFPHKPKTDKNFYDIMLSRLDDVKGFTYLAEKYLSRERTDQIMVPLYKYLEAHKEEFAQKTNDDLTIAIDNHSDNVFCDNGKASFLDIYQVKENWLLVEPMLNIYRLSADVLVLAGKEMQQALIQGYKDYYKLTDIEEHRALFYTVYGALIKGAYNYILDKPEEAIPYFKYIETSLNSF